MNAEQLAELNFEKRKELTKENLKYYEDMLLYIRLSYDKSEQETEEILSELLDHLLEAQKEGRTVKDVFGANPKKYADEIIGELPKMVTKERVKNIFNVILYFFASAAIFTPILMVIFNLISKKGSLVKEFFIGSLIIETLLSIPLAFLILYSIIQTLRWLCFKSIPKFVQLFLFWLIGVASVGIFLALLIIIPDFGRKVEIHTVYIFLTGIILLFFAIITGKSKYSNSNAKQE